MGNLLGPLATGPKCVHCGSLQKQEYDKKWSTARRQGIRCGNCRMFYVMKLPATNPPADPNPVWYDPYLPD
eukprot:g5989.t1